MTTLQIALIVSECIAVLLAWRILRVADGPLPLRIANALVGFIPFIGPPLAYWAANFPEPHHPAFRDEVRYSSDVYERWAPVIRMVDARKRFARWKALMGLPGDDASR